LCKELLDPSCEGLREKTRVPTENINEEGFINKGGKRRKGKKTRKKRKRKRKRKDTKKR
jgi:hypothetical protein